MIMPVTSTKVATNGADEVAGSNFKLFKMIGSIDPIRLPQRTIPVSEKKITVATLSQYWP